MSSVEVHWDLCGTLHGQWFGVLASRFTNFMEMLGWFRGCELLQSCISTPAYVCVMGLKSMDSMACRHKLWIKWPKKSVFMSHLCYLPTVWTWIIPTISPFPIEWRYWTKTPLCSVVRLDFTLMPAHKSWIKNLPAFWTVEAHSLLSVEMHDCSAVSSQRRNFSYLHEIHIFGSWVLWSKKILWGWVFSVPFHLKVFNIRSHEIGTVS